MSTKPNFDGLRVLVTGGTSGLGLALVQALTTRGANVAFVARTASSDGANRPLHRRARHRR